MPNVGSSQLYTQLTNLATPFKFMGMCTYVCVLIPAPGFMTLYPDNTHPTWQAKTPSTQSFTADLSAPQDEPQFRVLLFCTLVAKPNADSSADSFITHLKDSLL